MQFVLDNKVLIQVDNKLNILSKDMQELYSTQTKIPYTCTKHELVLPAVDHSLAKDAIRADAKCQTHIKITFFNSPTPQ